MGAVKADGGGTGREQVLEAARALLPADEDPTAAEVAAETIAHATLDAEEQPGDGLLGSHRNGIPAVLLSIFP